MRKWSYIDFERGLLNLPDSKTGKKSVYLNAPALEILSRLQRLAGNPFIFPGRKQGKLIAILDRPWTAIKQAAGLDGLRLDWYSPRGDLGRGEDGYAARKFRNERRDYERGLKIAEKITNGRKSIDAAIKEVLIDEKKLTENPTPKL